MAFLVGIFTACGSEDEKPDPTGDARRLDKLTLEERKAFCDWVAEQWGGYGESRECGDGLSASGVESQEECLRTPLTGCTATVAQAKVCIRAIVRDACKETIELPPECLALPSGCGTR